MKYHCLACNHTFEVDAGPKKPRCPRCMSIHDVEPAREGTGPTAAVTATGGRPSRAVALLLVALVGAAVASYFLVVRGATDAEDPPASTEDLLARLGRLGVPAEEAAAPFAVTDGVRGLAERLAGGATGPEAMGRLIGGLGDLREAGRFTPFHQRSLRADPPLTADEIAATLGGGGPPKVLSSYELACLLLASARALGLEDARMVRIHSFSGEQRPADPTGRFGRFGVAIGAEGEEPEIHEAFELRSGKAAKGDFEPLSETAAVAPFYNERALAALFRRDTAAAHRMNELAIKLDADAAAFRVARGLIFIAGGAPDEALAEYEKALKRRPDAVNHVLLADLLIKLGDTQATRAEGEVRAAIEKMPDYAQAHAVLGQIYSMRREFETAESELALAEKLDPLSPEVAMAWAIYHMVQHDNSEAIERAEQAVRLSGEAVDALLALAGIYRQTARFGQMREALDKVLAKVESPEMARELERIFDYSPGTAVVDDDEDGGPGTAIGAGLLAPEPGRLELQLGGQGSPLGGGGLGGGGLGGGGLGGGGLGGGGLGGGGLGGGGLGAPLQGKDLKLGDTL